MSTFAYWITSKGEILKPESRHILAIVKYPKKFGETDKTVEATFDKHKEQKLSNMEGKAREEVMLRVIRRGHIRIRINGTKRSQHWSIQVQKLTSKVNDKLWEWANKVINDGTAKDKFADVVIHELGSNDKMTRTDLSKIASGKAIREQRFLTKEETDQIHIYQESELPLLEDWIDYADQIEPAQLHENAKVQILANKLIDLR